MKTFLAVFYSFLVIFSQNVLAESAEQNGQRPEQIHQNAKPATMNIPFLLQNEIWLNLTEEEKNNYRENLREQRQKSNQGYGKQGFKNRLPNK